MTDLLVSYEVKVKVQESCVRVCLPRCRLKARKLENDML